MKTDGKRTALFVSTGYGKNGPVKPGRPGTESGPVHHLGFLYLSAILAPSGIDCAVMDLDFEQFELTDVARFVDVHRPVFVGFYSDSLMVDEVCGWIKGLRFLSRDLPIVVGGPGAIFPYVFLEAGATFVFTGEAESAIVPVVEAIDGRRDPESVPGIAYMKDNAVVVNQSAGLLENLDDLPFPRRDMIDMRQSRDLRDLGVRGPRATIITSRGCQRGCSYCSVPHVAGHRVRLRSPGNVLAEIDDLVLSYRVRHITFMDDCFATEPAWETSFLDGLLARRYDLTWTCRTHPLIFEKERSERMRRYRRAGCEFIVFGLPSSDAAVLRQARRSVREPTSVRLNVQEARKAGIRTQVEFILGLPGFTRETLEKDVEFALQIRPDRAVFHPLSRLNPSELNDMHGSGGDICGISDLELVSLARQADRRFSRNPHIMFPAFKYAIRRTPAWLRQGFGLAGKYLSSRVSRASSRQS